MLVLILIFILIIFDLDKIIELADINDSKYVYISGDVIGIKADTNGVLVLGYEDDVEYIDNVKEGDCILYVDEYKIDNSRQMYRILNKLKKENVVLTIERNKEIIKKTVKTKKENNTYKLGLWVRDKVSGIGTITCFDDDTGEFFAIGHPICDFDTKKLLKIKQGNIYNLSNLKIIKTQDYSVGQINGDFDLENRIGTFQKNSSCGIKGNLLKNSFSINKQDRFKVASFNEIERGKARIVFKPLNESQKYYNILINNINKDDKTLEIEIIDEDLVRLTGGIIQGMSGTPIIQNGKLVGSITYVLKDNPKKGFGIFIGEMIK